MTVGVISGLLFSVAMLLAGCKSDSKESTSKETIVSSKEIVKSFENQKDFENMISASDEVHLEQNPKRNHFGKVEVLLSEKQKEELIGQISFLVPTTETLEKEGGKQHAGLFIDYFICSITFRKNNDVLAQLKYYSIGKMETPDGRVWKSSQGKQFDMFIQSMGFHFPITVVKERR